MSYLSKARERARRRKSPWNLLLIPGVTIPSLALWWIQLVLLAALHETLYPGQVLRGAQGVGAVVAGVAPLFSAPPISMMLSNAAIALLGPARRALEREAQFVDGAGYVDSQRQLWRIAKWVSPTALLLGIVGAVVSWSYR